MKISYGAVLPLPPEEAFGSWPIRSTGRCSSPAERGVFDAWALCWCLHNPDVHSVVTGTKSVEQLESAAAAADLV